MLFSFLGILLNSFQLESLPWSCTFGPDSNAKTKCFMVDDEEADSTWVVHNGPHYDSEHLPVNLDSHGTYGVHVPGHTQQSKLTTFC